MYAGSTNRGTPSAVARDLPAAHVEADCACSTGVRRERNRFVADHLLKPPVRAPLWPRLQPLPPIGGRFGAPNQV
jgi:hypothetical protein